MFKITRSDLHKKSDRQLSALFNSLRLASEASPPASPERAFALALLAMVAQEQAVRHCRR